MRKCYKLLLVPLLACFLLFFLSPIANTSEINSFLLEIDLRFTEYLETDNEETILQIVTLLSDLKKKEPNNVEVLWRLGKAYHYLGIHRENNVTTWEQGKTYLEKALQYREDVADVYFWLAALTGQIGQEQGILNSLFMLQPMRQWLEKTIEIDSNYADAYYGLGRLYFQAPGWPLSFGDKNKALNFMRMAVRLNATDIEYQRGLFSVLEKLGHVEEAQEVLDTIRILEGE